MTMNLLKIDELVLRDHSYLDPSHECYYFLEYTSREGFNHSRTNDLIFNFKKKMTFKGHLSWRYKSMAIQEVSSLLRNALPGLIDINDVTMVPIPPSKTKANALYDDRMTQALRRAFPDADIREMLELIEDSDAAHEADVRPTIQELKDNCEVNKELADDSKDTIILFDDVITTGAHFVAYAGLILDEYPDKDIFGVFIARRHLPSPFADFMLEEIDE